MSGYEQRLAEDKAEIRRRVVEVGGDVEKAVSSAIEALLAHDKPRSYRIVLQDLPINREVRALNQRCHSFIARHIPSAGHLRFVSSVLQMNVALERIGDYAVSIARESVQLDSDIPEGLIDDLKGLTSQACELLRDALTAFSERDAELARKTRPRAKSVERSYSQVHQDLTREGAALPLADAFSLLSIFRRLERVADQAKNISEETLFELTGEQKAPKRYRILFVDANGRALSPLAEALARKGFPESGDYVSAALEPGGEVAPGVTELADRRGVDLIDVRPQPFSEQNADLERYHVIVALGQGIGDKLGDIPYASVLLEWDVAPPADESAEAYDRVANELSRQVRDLMVLMRGEDAP
jgi:phosphate transport system protein